MQHQITPIVPQNLTVWDVGALPLSLAVLLPGIWLTMTLITGRALMWVPFMATFKAGREEHPSYYWSAISWFSLMFIMAAGVGMWLRFSG